jgi:hypothetical protein
MDREVCLQLASDCLLAAKASTDPTDRQHLIRAATAWRELAELAAKKDTSSRRVALWNEPSAGRLQ